MTEYIRITDRIPLHGCIAFGIIDRGTNVLQVRPSTECPLSCTFCSTDAGPCSTMRAAEYIVDLQHLVDSFREAARRKGVNDIEAHIDTVGEPAAYPELVELVAALADTKNVKVVSMQSNGVLLDDRLLSDLDAGGLSRINLSIEALDPVLAKKIGGRNYPLGRVLENAEYITASTGIDLLIAPVWLPGINDAEMPGLIEYAKKIGAGRRYPPLGIQKYLPHKYGRKPAVKVMSWDLFYSKLSMLEKEHGVKLVLSPSDFGSYRCNPLPRVFRRHERASVEVLGQGWMKGEKLAQARDRLITVVGGGKIRAGSHIDVRMERVVDGIYIASPL
ncbi:MAG TPA: radical SAM protein [Candidatus Methanoperedenaceae archaeon]|nr:radical SAM protein [Candidatus Methanoperedenaceae archaeon]